ncbi:regulator of telomere elongation helicase 1 homolog [Ischnura elegans]|uniref:regulator of telomere elongation helicase 1 homolog n=1 Tax=Ischnura elegans TaxID=197161 RepID=UPI001ED8B70F|nr:regulator of telomere elongation helicase 1 homolog [Ischnura elegans]
MPEVIINGIPVNFPFQPYDVQVAYMSKVIECLQKGQNGILESPTGTGKTLSLLCSALGWVMVSKARLQAQSLGLLEGELPSGEAYFRDIKSGLSAAGNIPIEPYAWGGTPKVIYASRTHSQLTQAIQELKRTAYAHVRTAVLGSRDQMCIHPQVSQETSNAGKVHMCHHLVSTRACHFYNNVESKKEDVIFKESGPMDIEDLVKAGRKLQCCPYYVAKELKQNADIVFMPYNYILDPKSRKANGVELENKIVILDEAHNIEKMCEESTSLVLRSTDIAMCIDEVTKIMKDFGDLSQMNAQVFNGEDTLKDFTMEELCILKTLFLALEDAVDSIEVRSGSKDEDQSATHPGSYMIDLLGKVGITIEKKTVILDLLEKLIQYLTTSSMTSEGTSGSAPFQRRGNGLQSFSDLLKVVFSREMDSERHIENVKRCYKVHVTVEDPRKKKKADSWGSLKTVSSKATGRVVNYWCLSPGFGMQSLLDHKLRSLILTSGTLAPLPPLISELGIPVNVTLENPHIIKPHQVWMGVVKNGPDGFSLSSSYATRSDPKYVASLGQTIVNFSRIVPDGLLIFFPSYPLMNACRDSWQESGIWSRIQEKKPIFVEPQGKEGLNSAMNEYYAKIKDPEYRGACFMAVCRGKVSEGLDFADYNGRGVVVTGLPFPPYKDPRVVLKRSYLDENRNNKKADEKSLCQSGQDWYNLEASRAVNQAVGRVIRHASDYGAILLCDKRFDSPSFKKELSAWLQPHFKAYSNFGEVIKGVRDFFRRAEQLCPSKSVREEKRQTLCAAGASFDFTESKIVQGSASAAKENAEPVNHTPSWTPADYGPSSSNVSEPSKENKSSCLFTALESSSKAIDFNAAVETSAAKRPTNCDSLVPSQQVRKKLKIVPLNFNLKEPSGDILSDDSKNCSKSTNSDDKVKLGEKSKTEPRSGKAAEIATYLKQVRTRYIFIEIFG